MPEITMQTVVALWTSLEESKHWSQLEWANRCTDRPDVVVVGGADGETFAVLDMSERRVLSPEEFPDGDLERLRWTPV